MKALSDTPPEVERKLIEIYRGMAAWRKWQQVGQMYSDARVLHAGGVRLRNPAATACDILADWFQSNLGVDPPPTGRKTFGKNRMGNLEDLRRVLRAFAAVDIAYALGGSMASSIHGVSRSTRGADVSVEPFPGKEEKLLAELGPDQCIPLSMIRDALRRHASFNILSDTGFKVDVFVCQESGFEHEALRRRILFRSPLLPDEPFYIHTAEDVILFKLRWYRLGHEVSEQQWVDVMNVLRVQAGKLDEAYLDKWAAELSVTDLLSRARQESQLG